MQSAPRILILGASARAAAWSASRAGFEPDAVDLFGDRDLAAVARASARVAGADYPGGLEALALGMPAGPWMYTGAIENAPDLVDRVASARPELWGNPGRILRAVRDPVRVAEGLRRSGIDAPEVALEPIGLPRDGSWLLKPLASAAGRAIRPLTDGGWPTKGFYAQRFLDGTPIGATFLGRDGRAEFVGAARQLVGRPGSPFAYVGGVGPIALAEETRAALGRIGDALASSFGLLGLFGVDCILQGRVPRPIEVNPRYTATVELLELATGRALVGEHAACFGSGGPARRLPGGIGGCIGKEVIFAESPTRFGGSGWSPRAFNSGTRPPTIADIPAVGEEFPAGQPVLTVFARGADEAACAAALARRSGAWRRRLGRWTMGPGE